MERMIDLDDPAVEKRLEDPGAAGRLLETFRATVTSSDLLTT